VCHESWPHFSWPTLYISFVRYLWRPSLRYHCRRFCHSFFFLSFFLFYCTFSPQFARALPTKKWSRSTWNVKTMCRKVSITCQTFIRKCDQRLRNWNPTFEMLARHSRLWYTSIRRAANAVTASTHLPDKGDANTLQRGTRIAGPSTTQTQLLFVRNC